MENWTLGIVPWSAPELLETLHHELRLQSSSKDDWDLDAGRHVIDLGDQFKTLSQFHLGGQMIGYLAQKYPDGNLMRAHAFRYSLVKEFCHATPPP